MCGFPVYSTPQLCGGTDQEKEHDWSDMVFLACLIPPVCHSVYRVWDGLVRDQMLDITATFLTSNVLSTLR